METKKNNGGLTELFSIFSTADMKIIHNILSLRKWRMLKLDVKTAFLQTIQVERETSCRRESPAIAVDVSSGFFLLRCRIFQ